MSDTSSKSSWSRRILIVVGGLIAFLLLFVVALRITVTEMFRGIETSRATGLSAVSSWDVRSMWSTSETSVDDSRIGPLAESSIARSADLRARSSSFDHSVAALHECVSAHRGYFEDLRTERRSGHGRVLAATLSVVAADFDTALSDLKMLGRVEAISEVARISQSNSLPPNGT